MLVSRLEVVTLPSHLPIELPVKSCARELQLPVHEWPQTGLNPAPVMTLTWEEALGQQLICLNPDGLFCEQ